MKNYYLLFIITLSGLLVKAQGYELGIVHISQYDFKVVAIPDFTSSGNTDISDIGFTMVLPSGNTDVINQMGLLTARTWSVQEFDAAFLTGQGLGDGTKDVFQFNLPPGQSLVSHTAGQQIDLVSFTIDNMPTTGEMYFLLNSDPIATGAGGVLDSFYNSNIDATTTQDYFSGLAAGMDNFMFSTLSVNEISLMDNFVSVYPNPVSDIINIKTNLEIVKVELFDILGKQVLNAEVTNQLKINQFKAGVYFLKVHTANNSITRKIIIE
jgi:hypothetical protein